MKDLTECISLQFTKGSREIGTELTVKKATMTAAALMYQNRFKCFKAKSSIAEILIFLVPSQNCEDVNANESFYRSLVKIRWESFDGFINHGFQMFYIVKLTKMSWNKESTCVSFFKDNICKHIIAIAMREKIIECPDTANPTSLSEYKRKPGTAQKAKKALFKQ